MKYKRLIVLTVLVLNSAFCSAQIMLSPIIDSSIEGLNTNNETIAESRIRNIISSAGMASSYGGRFILACKISALQREVSGTKIIQHIEVSFAIGDNISNNCFGSTSVELYGIGNSEQQAMTNALKGIKNTPKLKELIVLSKERIVEYYDNNAPAIIKKAMGLINNQKWEEALYELTPIPEECSHYSEVLTVMEEAYSSKINHEAAQILNQAKAIWSSDPNPGPNAERAMEILATINTGAKCYPQAESLMHEIAKRVRNVKDSKIQYEREREAARLKSQTELAKERLAVYRDVAIAYAKKKTVVNHYYRSWW